MGEGFAASVAEKQAAGVWDVIEETPSCVSMPGRADTVPSRALALCIH